MPLDLEPVTKLDLDPVGPGLDLEPVSKLELEPADQLPPGVQAKALEEFQVMTGGLGAIDEYRQAEMRRKGGSVITSPQEVLAKKIAKASMTREDMQALGLPEWLAPIERGFAQGIGGLQDPENLLWMGGGAAAKPIAQGFIMDMVRQATTEAGKGAVDLAQGRTEEGLEKLSGAVTVGGTMYGLHRLGQVPIERRIPATEPTAPKVPVSEFGGEIPPPSSQAGPVNAAPGANVSEVLGTTVPETPKTLESQLAWLKERKRLAVLVPNETALPPIPEGMATHPTPAGTFIFDPERIPAAALDAHVQADTVGDLLGYGIPKRPTDGAAVVTVRGADGVEKQAVVTDQASLPNVLDAAKKVADPTDKVAVEPAEKVLAGRQQGAPVASVPSAEIATRPDLMQFKRMDESGTGVNAQDKLAGTWDDLKAGNLLLWEPQDPAAHGLEPGQKYIVANGHHRFEFGQRGKRQAYNAQVVREADGYSAGDARALAAEINIADGKGTIYDQVKFLRNEAATHGQDAAVARAGRTGTKGRQAQTIAFQAGSELFHSFINERITPEQAEAIAAAAPESEGLQRLGVRKAADGASPTELRNLIQAVRLEAKAVPAEQFDLFAADDTAIKTAEDLAKVASRIQGELSREIRATETAAKNATTAKAKGIRFDRPPEEILADNAKLKGERDRWDNWALHPDLVAQVRGYAEMERAGALKESGNYRAQIDKTQAGELSSIYGSSEKQAGEVLENQTPYQQGLPGFDTPLPGDAGTPGPGRLPTREAAAAKALRTLNAQALGEALARNKGKLSSIKPELAPHQIPAYRIAGTIIKSAGDFARTLIGLRSPYVETLKVVLLDEHGTVQHSQVLYAGTLDTAVFSGRDFARLYEIYGGKGKYKRMMISHNHPSGNPSPSGADVRATWALKEMAGRAGFEIVDHVITNGETYYSFAEGKENKLGTKTNPAAWEIMHRSELRPGTPDNFAELVASLRQTAKDVGHIIFLNTRMQVTAIHRIAATISPAAWTRAVINGVGREGAYAYTIDFGPEMPLEVAQNIAGAIQGDANITRAHMVDFAAKDLASAYAEGIVPSAPPSPQIMAEGAAGVMREEGEGYRATGEKIQASDAISDPTKAAITEWLYTKRSNATDQELANGIVANFGVDQAVQTFFNPPSSMPGSVRSKLLGSITHTLAGQERQARGAGDPAAAQGLAQRQADIWNQALPLITDLAQSLQALTDLVELSPEAQVLRFKGRLEQQAGEALDTKRDQVALVSQAIEAGRAEGIEAVRHDAAVNQAAAAAVDAAVAETEAVKRAIVMDMAEPWASSPAVMAAARAQVRLRADELLNKQPLPKGLSAAQHTRKILDDLAERAATIFAGHLQGAEPGVDLVDKLTQRLGLERKQAVNLAGTLTKEWQRQLKAAQEAIPKRIARQRVARDLATTGGVPEGAPDRLVDAAIRKQLRDLNVKLGELLKQEAERQDSTGAHVGERVVQASGLTGEKADTLRTTLTNRWNTLVGNAQRAKLEALEKSSGVRVSRPMRSAFDKLVDLTRLGALTGDRFLDVVKDSLKLKRLTPEDAAKLKGLVQKAQDLPEGYLRQQAASEVLKFTERSSGNASLRDLPLAIFYANILSGLTTPAKIAFENINLLAGGTVAAFITRPRELLHPVDFLSQVAKAYGRGLKKGMGQAAGTLRTGVVSGVWEEAKTPTILEMKPFGEKLEPLNFWKWFTRAIGISHELTFKPAWEVKQLLTARETAAREGLTGKALEQRTADLLANTAADVAKARAQALNELQTAGQLDALNLARRTGEILEQQRELNMPGSTAQAREFALRTAYLNEPYGFLGLLTTQLRSGLEKARKEFPIFGTGVKVQIPFTTIVANILNEKLNWTPVGIARAMRAGRTGMIYDRPALPGERAELYAKAITGTVALGALYALLGDRINGNGPSDPGKRKQLEADGWIPHSLKIGNRYYSYMHTPAGLGLAIIGNLNDWFRYGKGDETGAASRVSFALKATLNAIISQGMLDSVRRIFETVGSESTAQGAEKLEKLAARTASSFVFPNLVQQVDRMFDPTQYDQTGMEALVLSQIPFVRRGNKPVLNILGDTVHAGPWHHWASKITDDTLVRTLVEKQAWIPTPDRNQIVGDKKRGPEFFRALTPDEFYDFIAISGREIRRRLEDNIDVIATSEPDQARQFVAKIADEERRKAKKLLE